MGDARRSRQRQKNKGCGREKGRGGRRGTRGAAVSVRKKKTWGGTAGRGEGGGAGGGRAAQPSVSGGGGREKGDGIRTQGGAVGHWGDTRAGKGLCTKLVVCAPSPSAPPLPVNKYGEEKVVEEEKGEDSDAIRVRVCVCVRARWSAHACVHAQRWQGLSRAWTEPQAACGKGPRVQMLQQACGEHAVRRTLRLLCCLLRNVGRAPSLVAPRLPKCPSCSFLILSDLVVLAPRGHVLRGVSAFFFWAAKHRGVETVGTRADSVLVTKVARYKYKYKYGRVMARRNTARVHRLVLPEPAWAPALPVPGSRYQAPVAEASRHPPVQGAPPREPARPALRSERLSERLRPAVHGRAPGTVHSAV